jgi:hypothetical protein
MAAQKTLGGMVSHAGWIAILVAFLLSSGCASIISGKGQEVTFNSEPQEATVTVSGRVMGKTPITTRIDRASGQSITFEKEGYKTQTMALATTVNPWFWGNIILGGLIGSTTDGISGAFYEYSPSQYFITLAPTAPATIPEQDTRRGEVKTFIIAGYKNIIQELATGEDVYLTSLFNLLKITPEEKPEAMSNLKQMAAKYMDIPTFADEVANYYLKK